MPGQVENAALTLIQLYLQEEAIRAQLRNAKTDAERIAVGLQLAAIIDQITAARLNVPEADIASAHQRNHDSREIPPDLPPQGQHARGIPTPEKP